MRLLIASRNWVVFITSRTYSPSVKVGAEEHEDSARESAQMLARMLRQGALTSAAMDFGVDRRLPLNAEPSDVIEVFEGSAAGAFDESCHQEASEREESPLRSSVWKR
jgi:hypothetical protein